MVARQEERKAEGQEKGLAELGHQELAQIQDIKGLLEVAFRSGRCLVAFSYEDKKGLLQHRLETINFRTANMPISMMELNRLIVKNYDEIISGGVDSARDSK